MQSFVLGALLLWSGVASAQITSNAAWTQFERGPRDEAQIATFNRFVFREYRNFAVFLGDDASGRISFLADFLLHFPGTVVVAGHAALIDPDRTRAQFKPLELNLIVLDHRTHPRDVDWSALLARVDGWNREGLMVKVILNVEDIGAVLPGDIVARAELVEFAPGFAAAIRRTADDLTPPPNRVAAWRDLVEQAKQRRKLVMVQLEQAVRSFDRNLIYLLGDAESNAGIVPSLRKRLGLPPILELNAGEAPDVPAEPRRRFSLNLIRAKLGGADAPTVQDLHRLAQSVAKSNADGVFTRAIVEVTGRVRLPTSLRPRGPVISSKHECEALISWVQND